MPIDCITLDTMRSIGLCEMRKLSSQLASIEMSIQFTLFFFLDRTFRAFYFEFDWTVLRLSTEKPLKQLWACFSHVCEFIGLVLFIEHRQLAFISMRNVVFIHSTSPIPHTDVYRRFHCRFSNPKIPSKKLLSWKFLEFHGRSFILLELRNFNYFDYSNILIRCAFANVCLVWMWQLRKRKWSSCT